MLQRLREQLTVLLVAALPFHAFLVTVGTRVIQGPDHAPLTAVSLWKEALWGVILLLALVEIVSSFGKAVSGWRSVLSVDVIDGCIVALGVLAIIVQLFIAPQPRGEFLLGARYDFLPLVAFLILRRVPWSERFRDLLVRILLVVGVIVALLGILSFFLPLRFLVWLGYADLHSLYIPDQPLAPYQQIGESWVRRIQGTMSGPNQLGIWLLLPLSVLLSTARLRPFAWRWLGIAAVVLLALFLTFSRAAWIAGAVIVVVTMHRVLPRKAFARTCAWVGGVAVVLAIAVTVAFPSVFFRLSSSRGHLTRPIEAIAAMVRHPLGQGLGSAGPASNRNHEPCVFLRPQDDPSWAKSQPELCVFLGATQVQPTDHACDCPFLPENWYLQIGVELGVAGFILFILLVVLLLRQLNVQCTMYNEKCWEHFEDRGSFLGTHCTFYIVHFTFLFFMAVSVAALFLHAWEDAAVAYTGWILAAVNLRKR